MKKKNYFLVGICGLILLASIGLTYAFFSFVIDGNGAKVSIVADNLKLIYSDTMAISNEAIEPGWSTTKTFTVENTSNEELYYKISWKNLVNTFVNTSDLTIEITSTNGGGTLFKSPVPSASTAINKDIIIGIAIPAKTTQEYTVTFAYAKTSADQSADMGKTFSGTIEVDALESLGDANVLAYTCTTCEKTPSSFPSKNSGYTVKEVTCTNGAIGTWNDEEWGVDIRNITEPTSCTVDFAEQASYISGCGAGTLCAQIANDNPNVSTRAAGTFNAIFTTSNGGNTIYKATGQDNKDTYYFAGQVTNNYVKFGTNSSGAELWWRIVRVNEDGSVRLIYAGTAKDDTAAFISTSQAFNASYNMSYYVGYERSTTQHGLGTNSDIKGVVDTWYTNNLADEASYLSQTAIYCNDRTMGTGYTWAANPSDVRLYAGYERLVSKYASQSYYNKDVAPTFTCSENADRFTVSNTTGNGALENPIALITADEVAYAGAFFATDNANYYIAQNASSGATWWWTMSPSRWSSSGHAFVFNVGGSSGTGYLSWNYVYNPYGVRPVVSLKSCTLWSDGDGTSDNPYTVTINDACKSAIN